MWGAEEPGCLMSILSFTLCALPCWQPFCFLAGWSVFLDGWSSSWLAGVSSWFAGLSSWLAGVSYWLAGGFFWLAGVSSVLAGVFSCLAGFASWLAGVIFRSAGVSSSELAGCFVGRLGFLSGWLESFLTGRSSNWLARVVSCVARGVSCQL